MLITLKIFFISLIKYNYITTEWQEKVFPKFYCHRAKAGKVMTQSLAMTISLGLGATLIPNRTRKTVWGLKSSPGVPKYIFFYRQEARIWPTSFPGSLSHRRRKERTLGTRLDQLIMQQSESGSFKNICEYNPEFRCEIFTGATLFALVLHLNCTALSPSEWRNFFMCVSYFSVAVVASCIQKHWRSSTLDLHSSRFSINHWGRWDRTEMGVIIKHRVVFQIFIFFSNI